MFFLWVLNSSNVEPRIDQEAQELKSPAQNSPISSASSGHAAPNPASELRSPIPSSAHDVIQPDAQHPTTTIDSRGLSGRTTQSESLDSQTRENAKSLVDGHLEVGRPFPISRSIESHCRSAHVALYVERCTEVQALLAEFSQESRDARWASSVEANLRVHVSQKVAGGAIRALECRFSLCAIEVASVGDLFGILTEDEQRTYGVKDFEPHIVLVEPDLDPSGSQISVVLRVMRRRPQ